MVNLRPQTGPRHPQPRFRVLLTEDRPRRDEVEHWTCQLPRLLEPMGVRAYLAGTGREAINVAEEHVIHAAVVDLNTPVDNASDRSRYGGPDVWLLELLGRMPRRPPIVVVNSPALTQRQVQRLLHDALRLGVFAVLNQPFELNQLLAVFQKVLDRVYEGAWPEGRQATEPPSHQPPDDFNNP